MSNDENTKVAAPIKAENVIIVTIELDKKHHQELLDTLAGSMGGHYGCR